MTAGVVTRRDADISDLLAAAVDPGDGARVNPGGAAIVRKIDLMAKCSCIVKADNGYQIRVIRSQSPIHCRQSRAGDGLCKMLHRLCAPAKAAIPALPDSRVCP